jgi:hypothetical protein
MSYKPKYIYFYSSDSAVNSLLEQFPFRHEEPIYKRISKSEALIDYEHFVLFCFKRNFNYDVMRGHKCVQILVEDIVYDSLNQEQIDYILKPMMYPLDLLGGRIVRVETYREEK